MSKEAAVAQIDAVPTHVTRAHIVDSVRSFFSTYPAAQVEEILPRAELFASDAVFEDPVGAPPYVGKAAILDFFKSTLESGWIIHMHPEQIIVCGDEAISLTAGSWGLPDSEPAHVRLIHNFAFDHTGKIVRVRVFFDRGTVA